MEVADYGCDQVGEAATDYWSPCCEFGAVYALFYDDDLVGFQCAECGKDYDKDTVFDT
jgi:hypothetical protein